jgi:hypothetical protein
MVEKEVVLLRLQLLNFLNNLMKLLRMRDIPYKKFPTLIRFKCSVKECQAELTYQKMPVLLDSKLP